MDKQKVKNYDTVCIMMKFGRRTVRPLDGRKAKLVVTVTRKLSQAS